MFPTGHTLAALANAIFIGPELLTAYTNRSKTCGHASYVGYGILQKDLNSSIYSIYSSKMMRTIRMLGHTQPHTHAHYTHTPTRQPHVMCKRHIYATEILSNWIDKSPIPVDSIISTYITAHKRGGGA